MTTTHPTQGEHAQTEALRPIQRFNNIAGLMNPESRGLYVRYEDHAAQVAALTAQPAAPQGVAYADAHGAIMGAAYDFRDAHISGSPNQKRSAHAALESAVTHALRTSNGQAPAGVADARSDALCDSSYVAGAKAGFNLGVEHDYDALSRLVEGRHGYLQVLAATRPLPTPTAQAAPAAGAVAGPSYGATEFGWTYAHRTLTDGDKRLMALVVNLFGNDHQAFNDLETLIDRAPTPAAQADSESFERRLQAIAIDRDYWREQAQKADSVLEDAARGYELVGYINRGIEYHNKGKTIFHIKPTQNLKARWWTPDIAVYAARKQGGTHD